MSAFAIAIVSSITSLASLRRLGSFTILSTVIPPMLTDIPLNGKFQTFFHHLDGWMFASVIINTIVTMLCIFGFTSRGQS